VFSFSSSVFFSLANASTWRHFRFRCCCDVVIIDQKAGRRIGLLLCYFVRRLCVFCLRCWQLSWRRLSMLPWAYSLIIIFYIRCSM